MESLILTRKSDCFCAWITCRGKQHELNNLVVDRDDDRIMIMFDLSCEDELFEIHTIYLGEYANHANENDFIDLKWVAAYKGKGTLDCYSKFGSERVPILFHDIDRVKKGNG